MPLLWIGHDTFKQDLKMTEHALNGRLDRTDPCRTVAILSVRSIVLGIDSVQIKLCRLTVHCNSVSVRSAN